MYAACPTAKELLPATKLVELWPISARSPPQPPACATRVLARRGEFAAFGLVISEVISVGISNGLVSTRAWWWRGFAEPASQVSAIASPTYASLNLSEVESTRRI